MTAEKPSLTQHGLTPAAVSFRADGTAFSEAYGDIYHSAAGALGQARHVFLAGNGLPGRWRGRRRFTIVETGFGTGLNFLATWLGWRTFHGAAMPSSSSIATPEGGFHAPGAEGTPQGVVSSTGPDGPRLHFVSFERYPLVRDDMQRALMQHQGVTATNGTFRDGGPDRDADAQDRADLAPLIHALVDAWPSVLTNGVHRLSFDNDRVVLTLVFGDACECAGQMRLRADAFYLDGFSPACNPAMWQPRLFKALARMADEGATVATYTSAGQVRRDLIDAGFAVRRLPGFGGKRQMSAGPFAPRWRVRRHPPPVPAVCQPGDTGIDSPVNATSKHRTAMIIGAGVAGSAVADQLTRRGWHVVLIERSERAAQGASGNPAGIFHPVVTRDEGRATRWSRAAFLYALRYWRNLDRHDTDGAGHIGTLSTHRRLRWSDTGLVQRIARVSGTSVPNADDLDARGRTQKIVTDLANPNKAMEIPASAPSLSVTEDEGGDVPEAPGLPASIAERVTSPIIHALTGVSLQGDGWWFKEGGWIDPRSLIDCMLHRARSAAHAKTPTGRAPDDAPLIDTHTAHDVSPLDIRFGVHVARVSQHDGTWHAYDAENTIIASADIVVLANASDAERVAGINFLPTEPVRGQLTVLPLVPQIRSVHTRADTFEDTPLSAAHATLQALKMPLIGGAYVIPLPTPAHAKHEGRTGNPSDIGATLLTGASYQIGDTSTAIRDAEHRDNLARLALLLDLPPDTFLALSADPCASNDQLLNNTIGGRAAIRCVTGDRMPFVGQLPNTEVALAKASALRGAHLADVPRMPGLFGIFGLGSRGILWSALAAECLASLIEGEPAPIENDLLDAMDPARFLLRHLRRSSSEPR